MKARAAPAAPGEIADPGWHGFGLASLYQRWRQPLVGMLQGRTGSRAEAEDTAQQVFTQMVASGQLPEGGKERAYLSRVATHVRIDEWRRAGGDRALALVPQDSCADGLSALPDAGGSDPLDAAHHRQQLARLDVALAELPERQREAFSLYAVDGLTQEEVAQRMGISLRMVSKHVSRALAYCELRLQYGSFEQMQRLRAKSVETDHLNDRAGQCEGSA